MHAAKYGSLGLTVSTTLDVVVKHADLPNYGLEWHKEPMTIWAEWLDPYLGRCATHTTTTIFCCSLDSMTVNIVNRCSNSQMCFIMALTD